MALIDVRTKFIQDYTGRYDLVLEGTNFEDAGADYYINAGQRWLDRKVSHKKSPASVNIPVEVGGFYAIFTEARAVQRVWQSTASGGRYELRRLERHELRAMFPQDYAQIGQGGPLYYTPVNFRSIPGDANSFTIDQIGNIVYTSDLGGNFSFNGVIILPPTDRIINLEIEGLFYTPKLVNDTDQNFWTEQEPELLIQAACRAVEVSMRNRQGVADYEGVTTSALIDMDMDEVEEESFYIDQMRG